MHGAGIQLCVADGKPYFIRPDLGVIEGLQSAEALCDGFREGC